MGVIVLCLFRGRGGRVCLGGLFGQQDRLYIGYDAAAGDGHVAEQGVQLLVVPDGQEKMARGQAFPFVVPGGIPGELNQLGHEVLQHRRHVHSRSQADVLRVPPLPQIVATARNREDDPCPLRETCSRLDHQFAFSSCRHIDEPR